MKKLLTISLFLLLLFYPSHMISTEEDLTNNIITEVITSSHIEATTPEEVTHPNTISIEDEVAHPNTINIEEEVTHPNTINIEALVTKYCECQVCCNKPNWAKSVGETASGYYVRENYTIAMPSEFPFGTEVRIKHPDFEDIIYVCEDRGGSIKRIDDNLIRIDVYVKSHKEAHLYQERAEIIIKIPEEEGIYVRQ